MRRLLLTSFLQRKYIFHIYVHTAQQHRAHQKDKFVHEEKSLLEPRQIMVAL